MTAPGFASLRRFGADPRRADPAPGAVADRPRGGVAFTTRQGGVSAPPFDSLNLGLAGGDPGATATNLERLRTALGLTTLVGVHQVHGTAVVDPHDLIWDTPARAPATDSERLTGDPGHPPPGVFPAAAEADALVTQDRRVGLLIRVADCVPVLLADPEAGVIGAAHAGRVGLLAGVLDAVVAALRERGARSLTAWIGPHICGACYELPPDMAEAAWTRLPATWARSAWGTPAVDLGAGAAAELGRLGCAVVRLDPCTAQSSDLFSYRRDGTTGRLGGLIWLD